MEIDGIWNVAPKVIGEGGPQVYDPNGRVIHGIRQLCCLNESGMLQISNGRGFGIEGAWKGKEKTQNSWDQTI